MEATRSRITAPPPEFTPGPWVPTPNHPSRAVAGLLLAAHRHAEFEVLDSGRVRVPSASEPGLFYTVDLSGSGICGCPFWRFGDAFDGHRAMDKHLVAAEFVVAFRRAVAHLGCAGVAFSVTGRHDSRFGIGDYYEVLERSDDHPAGREFSTALTFEGALWEVIELMQERISEAANAEERKAATS